ncbi:ABC transporter substrate-binding protein [Holophaga foetida]|uniref:ABC transporter substrate-binding protein n=1 Tax=Holophaga foetida TaxID=35839 RepID=UPI0002473EF8|nr:ABC transporter substrate-binding protein [Holophaga foetida]
MRLPSWPSILLSACVALHAQTRTIVDMAGRTVRVPQQIRRIYAPTPYGSYMLFAVAPDLMSGLIFQLKEEDKPFLSPAVHKLPVIGGRFGGGANTNLEVLLKSKPDLLLLWAESNRSFTKDSDEALTKFGIPGATAILDNLEGYPAVFRFLGKLLGREERCERLATYSQKTLDKVQATLKRIPPAKRPKVYYAEGPDGLSTECNDSLHAELLKLAGDCNVHHCHTSGHVGMEKVSLEQVMIYNPDVLVVQEPTFYYRVWSDPAWQRVKAVKEGRIYLVPRSPLNWFDRPPSFMRILGIQWLMHSLYPKDYPVDIVKEARNFYALFLGAQVSDAQMQNVIYRK